MRLTDEQRLIVESNENVKVNACAGSGKCLKKGTLVMLFNGKTKSVENIKVGDLLMGDDSTPRTVLSTTSGIGQLYKVVPVKGDSFVCNENHILTLKQYVDHGRQPSIVVDMEIKDLLNQNIKLSKVRESGHYFSYKLLRKSVEFNEIPIEINPWLYGIWLGDGSQWNCQITNPDKEILDYIEQVIPEECKLTKKYDNKKCPYLNIVGKETGYGKNPFLTFVKKHGKEEKFIFDEYLYNSKEIRLDLLAGILDSDGYYDQRTYSIVSKYERFTDDIVYLCRSLGLAAYKSQVMKRCMNCDNKELRPYYSISISGDLDIIPNRLSRKKANPRKIKKDALCVGFKIEEDGIGEYYGFELDGNHRFLLGDFTVTHNSSSSLAYIKAKQGSRILYLAYNRLAAAEFKEKVKKHNLECDVMTSHSLAYQRLHLMGVRPNCTGYFTFSMFEDFYRVSFNIQKEDSWRLYKKMVKSLEDWACLDRSIEQHCELENFSDPEASLFEHIYEDMWRGDIPVTHDFYLKVYSEMEEQLGYDYIIVDEAQDSTYSLLKIVTSQENTVKLLVGDDSQSIYGFRKAVNALSSPLLDEYQSLYLTQSFRFTQRIANLANEVLKWKSIVSNFKHVPIIGLQESIQIPKMAIITRTNFELLRQAYFGAQQKRTMFIEGQLPLDVYHSNILDFNLIRRGQKPENKFLAKFKDLESAKNYFAKDEDFEKMALIKLVEVFGSDSKDIIPKVKQSLVAKSNADVVVTNTHKAKGLEYGEVIIGSDFVKFNEIGDKENVDYIEEINLLYVAITRSGDKITFPIDSNYNQFKINNLI